MTVGQYVTDEGLVIPTIQQLLDIVAAELRSNPAVGPTLDVSPESPIGQLIGVFVSHVREDWEGLQIAYNGNDPDAAESFLLDALCKITGTTRAAATSSSFAGQGRIRLALNANVTVNAGALVSQAANPAVVFVTTENIASTTAGIYAVAARCTQVGPIACPANTLTVINTPVVGWTAVTNPVDATLGTNTDSDAQLRVRRVNELEIASSGTVAAITAALLSYETDDLVHPITDAITYENTSDYLDAFGRPPHSIEALLYDGDTPSVDDDTIAQLIWDNRGAGVATYGNTSDGVAVDYLGVQRLVNFSRPQIFALGLVITIAYDASKPPPSSAEVKAACAAALLAHNKLGQTLIRWNIFDAACQDNVSNCLGSTNIQIQGGAPFTNFVVAQRTKCTLSTTSVAVTLVASTP